MERFRGGLAFKAHRLLNYLTLGSRVINKKKKDDLVYFPLLLLHRSLVYWGTSLIRNSALLGPYSRTIPRVLWWS